MCSEKRLGLFWIGQGRFFKSFRGKTASIGSKILFRKSIEQPENEHRLQYRKSHSKFERT